MQLAGLGVYVRPTYESLVARVMIGTLLHLGLSIKVHKCDDG